MASATVILSRGWENQSHNLHWCHWIGIILGVAWGGDTLEGDDFGNGCPWEWKRTKNGHFLLYKGSWSQDRICDRLKAPRLAHFREGDEAGRLALGSRTTLHIRVQLSLHTGTGDCNANQLSLLYSSSSYQMREHICLCLYAWLLIVLMGWRIVRIPSERQRAFVLSKQVR